MIRQSSPVKNSPYKGEMNKIFLKDNRGGAPILDRGISKRVYKSLRLIDYKFECTLLLDFATRI